MEATLTGRYAVGDGGQLVLTPMTEAEALECVTAIRLAVSNTRARLFDLWQRQGWKALGYATLEACFDAEFGEDRSYLFRQLAAARVERNLESPIGDLPESQLRPLASLPPETQREVWAEVNAATDGKRTAAGVAEAADRHRPPPPPPPPASQTVTARLTLEASPAAEPAAAHPRADTEAATPKSEHPTADAQEPAPKAIGQYQTIIADPPWEYVLWSPKGDGRCASDHYETQRLDWILALPVWKAAAKDCTLLLWTTAPHLPLGCRVLEAWGFEYKTCLTWAKMTRDAAPRIGMGYHLRGATEFLLIAQRGNARAPEPSKRPPSIFFCPIGEHSAKPDYQYEIAELYAGPHLELFHRPRNGMFPPREGWRFLGREVDGRDMRDALDALAEEGMSRDESICDRCQHPFPTNQGHWVAFRFENGRLREQGDWCCPACAATAGVPPEDDPPEDGTEDAARWLEEHGEEPAPIREGERIAWLAKSGAPAEGVVRGLGVGGGGEGYSVEKAGDPPGRRVWVARDAEGLRRVEESNATP